MDSWTIYSALNKVLGKKVEAATMVAKVREFLKEKETYGNVLSHSLVHLQMCNTDLDHLYKCLCSLLDNNLFFSHENFGIDIDGFNLLRGKLATKIEKASKDKKREEKESEQLSQTYQKAIKTRALPKITKATWPRFLSLWDTDKVKYSKDDARVSILRQHLTDSNDLQAADLHVTLESLESYLIRRYGAQSIILSTLLKDLIAKNKAPKSDQEEENSCNRLRNITSYFKTTEHFKLLSISKITELIDVSFQKDNKNTVLGTFFFSLSTNQHKTT